MLSGCASTQTEDQKDVQSTEQSASATLVLSPSMSAFSITETASPTIQATLLPPSVTPEVPTASYTPTIAPSATAISTELVPPGWIAFALLAESIDIIRTDGTGWRRIVENIEFPTNPTWSPDGQWIAFIGSSNDGNPGTQIYLVRPDGSEIKPLPFTSGYQDSPSWSSDGQLLIYSQINGSPGQKEVDLFLYDLAHQKVIQVTDTPGVAEFDPVFSPHGDTIAYTADGNDVHPHIHNLMLMDLNSGNIRQVLETPMNVDSLTWSPDGTQIVFSSSGTETSYYACNDLYMINVDGSGLKSLTASPFRDSFPNWSPDGEWITFNRAVCNYPSAPGFEQIYIIHSGGSGLKQLADIPGSTHPDWSPWPALQNSETFIITELGANLNLRAAPSLAGDVLEKLEEGAKILVLEGPIEADEFLWWQVRVIDSNLEGWIAETPSWFVR